ncbi:uncharacterized protein METZ01_LOCUS461398, partial [marine metagenome]
PVRHRCHGVVLRRGSVGRSVFGPSTHDCRAPRDGPGRGDPHRDPIGSGDELPVGLLGAHHDLPVLGGDAASDARVGGGRLPGSGVWPARWWEGPFRCTDRILCGPCVRCGSAKRRRIRYTGAKRGRFPHRHLDLHRLRPRHRPPRLGGSPGHLSAERSREPTEALVRWHPRGMPDAHRVAPSRDRRVRLRRLQGNGRLLAPRPRCTRFRRGGRFGNWDTVVLDSRHRGRRRRLSRRPYRFVKGHSMGLCYP